MQRAQIPGNHHGSVIRLRDDGSVPPDNPFVGKPGWRPEKYDLGHRNMQGAALHPQTGELWTHEHGPQGGDEINIVRPGTNYGWPVISYGVNYGTGTKIGEGAHKEGLAQPLYYWVLSIAPSGMAYYTGERFPRWKGNLFVRRTARRDAGAARARRRQSGVGGAVAQGCARPHPRCAQRACWRASSRRAQLPSRASTSS
jgi:glucose/arabinose dehydrogenase